MSWRLALSALALALFAAGCLGLPGTDDASERVGSSADEADASQPLDRWKRFLEAPQEREPPEIRDPGRDEPTAVVAVIGGGINPFHEHFERPELLEPGTLPVDARNADTGQPPVYVPTGLDEARETGQQAWLNDAIEEGRLYRFAGTNLLYYRVPGTEAPPMQPDAFSTVHPTFTAGVAAEHAPIVVLVQSYRTYPKAMEWAAAQPWIDAISTQIPPECLAGQGVGEACPHAAMAGPLDERFNASRVADATREAWDSGKLVLASGGNDPKALTQVERVRGPPWVVAVGGADTYRGGATVASSQTIDLVSNFTNRGPHASETDAYYNATGTSGSAPLVAGTLADALADVREEVGHAGTLEDGRLVASDELTVTNEAAWEAINRTAVYWNASDYDPTADHPQPNPLRSGSALVNPAAPWTQMGWGYLGPDHADAIAEALVSGELPDKPQGAEAWMQTRQETRRALWR